MLLVLKIETLCFRFRYSGIVFAVKPKKGSSCRVRVKFDMYPKDKYDKWYVSTLNCQDLRETQLCSSPIATENNLKIN